MNQEELWERIREYTPINNSDLKRFFEYLRFRKLKKNEFLIHMGEQPSNFVLIQKGCLMTYYTDPRDFDHVLQFGFESWWTGDIEGITQQRPSNYSIKAMLDSEVYEMSFEDYEKLCEELPIFNVYFKLIFQNSLITHQRRLMRNISQPAEERYNAFIEKYPRIELLIPQKYIASYLGITPEFLSKIRSGRYK